jgi:hypothetical protein
MSNEVQELNGGSMLRYAHGSAEPEATYVQREANLAHPGGGVRFTNGAHEEGEVFGTVQRHNTYSETVPAGSSIMSTARRDSKGTSVELVPGQPSSRTLIQVALREGAVREVAAGVFVDNITAAEDPAVPQQAQQGTDQQQASDDPGAGVFDPAETQDWLSDLSDHGITQTAYDSATARAIEAVVSGTGFEAVALKLAQEAGIEPARAAQFLDSGPAMHQRVADRELAKIGIAGAELESCYGWMREAKGPAMRHCMQQLVLSRDIQPLKKLAGEWRAEQGRNR